jgi:hypothetical protein
MIWTANILNSSAKFPRLAGRKYRIYFDHPVLIPVNMGTIYIILNLSKLQAWQAFLIRKLIIAADKILNYFVTARKQIF